MTGLNPNDGIYPFLPFKTHKTSAKILVYLRSPVPSDSAVTTTLRPPNFECTHLLLRSADWWGHSIIFSLAWTIWILSECKLSTDNYVNYQEGYYAIWLITWWLTMKIAPICLLTACKWRKFQLVGDSSQVRAIDNGITWLGIPLRSAR